MANFNNIDSIKVGTNSTGTIKSDGNTYAILSASYNLNYDSPSVFALTIASSDVGVEMKSYLAKCGVFKTDNLESIKVVRGSVKSEDSDKNLVFNFFGFLSSYTESISAGERTYQLEFVDRSILLDKIFVGLTNRHQKESKKSSGQVEVNALCSPNPSQKKLSLKTATIKFGEGGLGPNLGSSNIYSRISTGDVFAGGLLVLGDEQFSENFCEVPMVDYTFNDLLSGLGNIGIRFTFTGTKGDFAALNKAGIRRQFVGTLREVLNSFCAEYSMSYIWQDDQGGNDALGIRFFSLSKGIAQNKSIKALRDDFLSKGVQNLEYSVDGKSTKAQGIVSRVIRPFKFQSDEINFTRPLPCSPITVGRIRHGYNTPPGNDSLLISCMLAKLNPDIRTLYYSLNDRLRGTNFGFEAIGVYFVKKDVALVGQSGQAVKKNNPLRAFFMEEINEALLDFGTDVKVSIVYRSADMENRFVEYEKNIAENFVGRYFQSGLYTVIPDTTTCSAIGGRRVRVADSEPPFIAAAGAATGDPNTEGEAFPVEEFSNPYGADTIRTAELARATQHGIDFFKVIKRDNAPWYIKNHKGINAETDFKSFVPRFIPISADAHDTLLESGVIDQLDRNFSLGGAQFSLGIYIEPNSSDFLAIKRVNDVNPNEKPAQTVSQDDTDTSKCAPSCSFDIGAFLCGQEVTGSNFSHGPRTQRGFGIRVSLRPYRTASDSFFDTTIITPSGAKALQSYTRLEKVSFKNFASQRGIKVFESSLPENTDNAASFEVIDQDMTSNMVFTVESNSNRVLQGETYIVTGGVGKSLMQLVGKEGIKQYSQNMGSLQFGLQEFHNASKKGIVTISAPSETLSVTIPSHLLDKRMGPVDGLSSMDFSYTSQGSEVTLSFRSLPPKPLNRELLVPMHRMFRTLTTHANS